uniref:Uncharacterized protein n=1 Tax=Anguilla anguilla TaxID=7936 RepID=A0A0E9WT05_ANGAN
MRGFTAGINHLVVLSVGRDLLRELTLEHTTEFIQARNHITAPSVGRISLS